MNLGRCLSWNDSGIDKNIVLPRGTDETIDLTNGEIRCWSFSWLVDVGIH